MTGIISTRTYDEFISPSHFICMLLLHVLILQNLQTMRKEYNVYAFAFAAGAFFAAVAAAAGKRPRSLFISFSESFARYVEFFSSS